MSTGSFSVTLTEPTRQISDPTRPDQIVMTPKVEFSKYSINIIHGAKFIFNNVKYVNMTCRSMHDKQQNKTIKYLLFKTKKAMSFKNRTKYIPRIFDPTLPAEIYILKILTRSGSTLDPTIPAD